MIINSIHAENVLKYERMSLIDLPSSGIIAVEGENESGKSTIGETICFALFGRTFSLTEDHLDKIIHWGAVDCSARLVFTSADGKQYEVARFLDLDGNHSSRISLADDPENSIVRGNEAVKIKLHELTGYDFEQFIDSFYLAQREITMPHAHGHTVKTMAGIASLERVMKSFIDEIASEKEIVAETMVEAETIAEERAELAIDETLMPELQSDRELVAEEERTRTQQAESLKSAMSDYKENMPRYWVENRKRGKAGLLCILSLLLAAAFTTLWAIPKFLPDSSASAYLKNLLLGNSQQEVSLWLLLAAVLFAILFIVFWIRRSTHHRQMLQHREKAAVLFGELEKIPDAYQQTHSDEDEPPLTNVVTKPALRPEQDVFEQLLAGARDLTAPVSEISATISKELAWEQEQLMRVQDNAADLEQKIETEQLRLDKASQLDAIHANLLDKANDLERRVAMRELGKDLLSGAASHITKRFNQDLRDLVTVTLPPLTEGRYEYLKIDEELSVQAFSSEKKDFVDLDEVSSGTQRQIMLSVRLALAQELINRTVQGNQFLFLDEPFAFFDRKRTRDALEVLPALSDEISQIWIIAQQFPEDMTFDRHLHCARDYTSIPNE